MCLLSHVLKLLPDDNPLHGNLSRGRGPSSHCYQSTHNPIYITILLLVFLFVLNTLTVDCQPDENYLATCAHEKCETVGSLEVCTQVRVRALVETWQSCKGAPTSTRASTTMTAYMATERLRTPMWTRLLAAIFPTASHVLAIHVQNVTTICSR